MKTNKYVLIRTISWGLALCLTATVVGQHKNSLPNKVTVKADAKDKTSQEWRENIEKLTGRSRTFYYTVEKSFNAHLDLTRVDPEMTEALLTAREMQATAHFKLLSLRALSRKNVDFEFFPQENARAELNGEVAYVMALVAQGEIDEFNDRKNKKLPELPLRELRLAAINRVPALFEHAISPGKTVFHHRLEKEEDRMLSNAVRTLPIDSSKIDPAVASEKILAAKLYFIERQIEIFAKAGTKR
jgi:hypothetical protein